MIAFSTGYSVVRYICSLAPLISPTRSAALHFAMLASLARSVQRLAHSLHSLPRGTVEIFEYLFTLLSRFTGTNAFLALTRNTPWIWKCFYWPWESWLFRETRFQREHIFMNFNHPTREWVKWVNKRSVASVAKWSSAEQVSGMSGVSKRI